MIYTEIYQPRISDYDRNGKLSYEAILQILETAGSHHSNSVGDHVIEGSQRGIAWILSAWRVQILHRTNSKENLYIATWAHGKAPASVVYRDFVLSDQNGNEMIRAEAKFALLDLASGRLTRITEDLFASYQPEDKIIFDTSTPKLQIPEEFDSEQMITLRRSDIDFNGHVHNTRYLDFAMEVLPEAIHGIHDVSEIHINYRKPVKEGSMITVKRTTTETSHIVCIYSNTELCTLIEILF